MDVDSRGDTSALIHGKIWNLELQEDGAHGDLSLWSRAPAIKLGSGLFLRKALVTRNHKNFGIFTHLVNQNLV